MDTDATVTEPDAEAEIARTSALKSGRRPSIELITRAEPRRRWSVEQKQSIAAESLAPGASPTAVAWRHGISSGLLYTWRKALLAAQPSIARFARVEVTGSAKPAAATPNAVSLPAPGAGTIEIVLPNRTTVRVDAQIDPRALRRVLSVLAKQ
jgi:transposase